MTRRQYVLFGLLIGVVAPALLLAVGWWQVDGPGAKPKTAPLPLAISEMDFSLSDHEGNPVGPATLIGRPSMVFFGFTFCPDICPTTLADISGWLNLLGADADSMNTVFITVDPARDTAAAMAEYVSYFHPAIRGWTGPDAEIAKAAADFRVKFERVPTEGNGYTMNHTASVFLFDATGRFVSTIDYHEPREVAVPKIRRAFGQQNEVQG